MAEQEYQVEDVLPHRHPMILIDEIVHSGDDFLEAAVSINERSQFYQSPEGVAAWVGIEYMAQAIAAFAGVKAKQHNEPVKIGLLIGIRHFRSKIDFFQNRIRLLIRAELEYESDEMKIFNCSIANTDTIATAQINVFQPKEIDSFLNHQKDAQKRSSYGLE